MKRQASWMSRGIGICILVEISLFALFFASEMFFAISKRTAADAIFTGLFSLFIFSLGMLWFNGLRALNRPPWILTVIFTALVAFLTLRQVLALGPHEAPFFTSFFVWHACVFGLMFTPQVLPLWRFPKTEENKEVQAVEDTPLLGPPRC